MTLQDAIYNLWKAAEISRGSQQLGKSRLHTFSKKAKVTVVNYRPVSPTLENHEASPLGTYFCAHEEVGDDWVQLAWIYPG